MDESNGGKDDNLVLTEAEVLRKEDKLLESAENREAVEQEQEDLKERKRSLEEKEKEFGMRQESHDTSMREQVWGGRIKITAVVVAVAVIVFMGWILVDQLICRPYMYKNHEFAWAVFVTPVASITVITATLLFGAFRRFRGDDLGTLTNRVTQGTTMSTGMSG